MAKRILPAYPLFVKDPYFSIWSPADEPNGADTVFWTGEHKKRLYGLARIGGKTYSFLGAIGAEKAECTKIGVTAFTTEYTFRAGEAELHVRFVSPLPPDDTELLRSPVCYMTYTCSEEAELMLLAGEELCYNPDCPDKRIRGGSAAVEGGEVAFFGLGRQFRLSNNFDAAGADWGYYYLSGSRARFVSEKELRLLTGVKFSKGSYLFASCRGREGQFFLAFDDTVSIDYFGELLKGFEGTAIEAICKTRKTLPAIEKELSDFDETLKRRAEPFGEEYYPILCASLRQSVGAHKAVYGRDGELLFLSKECCSNGCIATVDVSYPSIPLYLLYAPELVRGMLRPILRFARSPVWEFPFAPHDCGTYPSCTGQVYGLNDGEEASEELLCALRGPERGTRFPLYVLPSGKNVYLRKYQMPVEESANVLIMLAACYRADGKLTLTRLHYDLLERWAGFLAENGLHPESQLCTDDFAGHLGNNVNLAIKAAVGLACFALLADAVGEEADAKRFRAEAERFASVILAARREGVLPLTYDSEEETFSLKYNLFFDKALSLGLFPQELLERETELCLKKQNRYGTPLDNRKDYTKSDWIVWTAALTDDPEKRRALFRPLKRFLEEGADRIPFTDWFDTVTGRTMGFRNRTVQGGCFALLLRGFYAERG